MKRSRTLLEPNIGPPARFAKTAAYVRVSSETQDNAMQREAISRACSARGDDIAQRDWHEEKRSGDDKTRPVLERVRQLAREGSIGRLYVYRLDRLSRGGIRHMLAIVDELRGYGCELVTIADGFDLNGPAAEIVLCVLAWAAQHELRVNRERRNDARARVLAAGGTWGRPKRMSPQLEQRALTLVDEGRSVRAIAMALKIPKATVSRTLRRLKSAPSNGAIRKAEKAPRRKSEPPPGH
jgi:DNA invertase Pin-like site-specific DNA recombinase